MTTIIDALVVTLGLDVGQFDKGQRRASEAFKKTRDEAVKHGKDIEQAGDKSAESFRGMTRELATFLAKIASATALTQFLSSLNQINAATGRVAQTLEMSPQALSSFEMAVERAGGTADGAATSLRNLRQIYNDLVTTGNSSALQPLGQLQALGGSKFNYQKPLTEQLGAVAENLKNVSRIYGASRAFDLARRIGIDEGTARLLMQGRAGLAEALNATKGLAATKEQTDASIRLQKAWVELTQTLQAAGRELMERLTPSLLSLIDTLKKLAGLLHDKVVTDILDAIKMIGDAFGDFGTDIKKIISGLIMWADEKWFSMTGLHMLNDETRKSMAAEGIGGSYGAASERMKRMGGATGKWWTPERQKYAIDYLMKNAGLSEYGAAGLVARWAGIESPGGPDSVNPTSGARGIAQGLGSRKAGYTGTFDEQLANAARELNTTERRAGDVLRAAKSAAEGARGASIFERAEGYNPATGLDNYTGSTPVADVYNKAFGSSPASASSAPRFTKGNGWTRLDVGAAAAANINNSRSSSVVNNSSAQTSIGNVVVNTPATDGHGIARDLQNAITHHSFAAHLNYGGV